MFSFALTQMIQMLQRALHPNREYHPLIRHDVIDNGSSNVNGTTLEFWDRIPAPFKWHCIRTRNSSKWVEVQFWYWLPPFKLFSDVTICCSAKLADFIFPLNSCSAIFLSNRCVLLPTQCHYLVKETLNQIKTPPFTLLRPSSFRFILRIPTPPLPPHLSPPHLPTPPPLAHFSFCVYILCAFLEKACLSSAALCVTDSLTITLEEIPRVACQSQLAANPNWVERSIFLYKSWNMAVSKLLDSRAPREQPYK